MPQKKKSVEQIIRERAYEIYQNRLKDQTAGDEISDWIKAEEAIRSLDSKKMNYSTGEGLVVR